MNSHNSTLYFWENDANKIGTDINAHLLPNSLSFCFVDPNHMGDLKFNTLESISSDRKVDLLINFAYFMDYKRSVGMTESKFDEFFGTTEWKFIEDKYRSRDISFRANALLDLYMDQLLKIGYVLPPNDEKYKNYFLVHTPDNLNLYYLVFASKHNLGYEFCRKMRPYVKKQQELNI